MVEECVDDGVQRGVDVPQPRCEDEESHRGLELVHPRLVGNGRKNVASEERDPTEQEATWKKDETLAYFFLQTCLTYPWILGNNVFFPPLQLDR